MQYGVLAGLTVYAVPQVLAATAPVAALSVQVGTLVKLVRVLMLGPVVLVLSLGASRLREETDEAASHVSTGERPKPGKLAVSSPRAVVHPGIPRHGGAALGWIDPTGCPVADRHDRQRAHHRLDGRARARVDVRSVVGAGARVTLAVVASLVALTAVSLGLIRILGIA